MAAEKARIPVASVFHDRVQARKAATRLLSEGIPRTSITVLSLRTLRPDSFLVLNVPKSEEYSLYAAIEAGAVVVVAAPEPALLSRAREILHGAANDLLENARSVAPDSARRGLALAPGVEVAEDIDAPFLPQSF